MESNSVCRKAAVFFIISFRELCLIVVSLPLCALLICFVTAYIFQQDDIHETHCRVYNIIPSISAITGVSPQRYLWRICIALHIGPRLIIAWVYRSYYRSILWQLSNGLEDVRANRLLKICFWFNILEISALCGVTYISNRDNYPLHEKIFIVFMIASLSYMLATIKVFQALHPDMNDSECRSFFMKKLLFITSCCSTAGLLVFFLKHRLLCHDMGERRHWCTGIPQVVGLLVGREPSARSIVVAFSWFSLCEYLIASANMAFHVTVILDFPTEELLVARGLDIPWHAVCHEKHGHDRRAKHPAGNKME